MRLRDSALTDGLLRRIPKAELHIHIEGSLEPEMMFELAARNGVRLRARESQHQLPGLSNQIMPEAMMRLLVDEPEAHSFVDAAGGVKHVIRPQGDLSVAGLSGEANTFFHQAAADAEPAYFRLDEEKSQLGDLLRLPDEEHTTDDLAIPVGDPTTLQFRVVLPDELRHDLRHERLEPLIPAVLSGVEDAVAVDNPAHVAGQVGPEKVRDHRLG